MLITGADPAGISTAIDGQDLILTLADGGVITIKSHLQDRGRIEDVLVDGLEFALPDVSVDVLPGTTAGSLTGTDDADKLTGTDADDEISDGGGVDNLIGGAGKDVFILAADGDADSIKDFEVGIDRIDVSAWGAVAAADLAISDATNGKVTVRYGDEVLSVTDAARSVRASDMTSEHFIFGTPVSGIQGTDQEDKLFGGSGGQVITDGAGKDNLWGGAGADTFVLVADGVADGIKDFEVGLDLIDVQAWGVNGFDDLEISVSGNGKVVVRHQAEVLSVTDIDRLLLPADLTETAFIF